MQKVCTKTVISLERDFETCIAQVDAFLPFVDNWATCDQLSPKAFKKEPEKLLPYIRAWIQSDKTYTVRCAIGMLMQHFLDERFDTKYADMVAEVRSEEYYINMMIACCNDGTRPVIFKIERIDIPESDEEREWLSKQNYTNTAEDAYTG